MREGLPGRRLASLFAIAWLLCLPQVFSQTVPPILVLTNSTNPFSTYYSEILKTEGLNEFEFKNTSSLSPATLAPYDVVILGQITLAEAQVTTLSNWVAGGGNLIAMRPDKKLAALLGLVDASATLSNRYLLVNTATGPGVGIVGQTIQYHDGADLYTLGGAAAVATLYSNAVTPTVFPAVTLRSVGTNGGQAAAFTFDLARSVVYTRQGNPAWVGQERDGVPPLRPNDLFFGAASGDVQPDWIDFNKVAIPQADEQQRLMANMIIRMNSDRKPLPRFWYFPNNHKAVVVMTGDDHAWGGTAERFDQHIAYSPPGGSVDDWQTIRSTSYLWTNSPMTDAQAVAYTAAGFEVALHLDTYSSNYTAASLNAYFTNQMTRWKARYPSLPSPATHRIHGLVWNGYTIPIEVGLQFGIRLDTSYYYWPSTWVANRPGMFTGSGMPMRFATTNGVTLDVFQANTQMTDESGQSYPFTANSLLDHALGPDGYYGFFVANMHTDFNYPGYDGLTGSDAIIQSAKERGVPVISSRQLLTWLDARNASSMNSIQWSNGTLTFSIVADSAAKGLQTMSPVPAGYTVATFAHDGNTADYSFKIVKGIQYAVFPASNGVYQIHYELDTLPPIVTSVTPAANASGVSTHAAVEVEFSESMDAFSITTNTFTLRDASNLPVAATVAYNDSQHAATLIPDAPLTLAAHYTVTMKGGVGGVTDLASNKLASDFTWSFDVVPGVEGTIGNTNEGNVADYIWFNGEWINARRVQANTNWTLTTLFAKVTATTTGTYKCAIYSGNATQPTVLQRVTEATSVATNGWQAFPLTSALTLTNGQYYWLAIWSDDPEAQVYYTDASGVMRWEPYAYGEWPNPIITTSGGTFNYCIYASGYLSPPITHLTLTPANPSVPLGTSQQINAIATYSNGSTQNVSSQALWTSSNTVVATVSSGGLATGLLPGTATISASLNGATGGTLLTVTSTGATTTSVGTSGTPSTYGSAVTFTATVSPSTVTGTVSFYDGTNLMGSSLLSGSTTKTATFATATTQLSVGVHAIKATYNGDGTHNSSTSSVLNQTVNALPIQLFGTRVYDATATMAAGALTIDNNFDSENLTMTGTGLLSSRDAGSRAITAPGMPIRVNSATGNSGANQVTSFNITVAAPVNGNTLIAVISTRGTSTNRVSSISQTGATWSRASQAANSGGITTEIWYAPNVSGAGTTVAINLAASLRAAAVVIEYSGVFSAAAVDQTASVTGNSASPVTGTTQSTTQSNELWIGGIGFISSTPTLGTVLDSFSSIGPAASTSTTAANNSKVYALERIVSGIGAAVSGGTLSTSAQWAGAMATFKAALPSGTPLTLGGSAAGNYTLTGLSGSANITPKELTTTGVSASQKPYDGTTVAALTGTGSLLASELPGAGTSADGKPYAGDVVNLTGTPLGTFASANVNLGLSVSVSGLSLAGAQATNYSLTTPVLSANITPSPLTVTANHANKTYDGFAYSGGNGVTYDGFVNGEGAGVLAGTMTFGGTSQGAVNAGSYSVIPAGLSSLNYAITFVSGNLQITAAAAIVTLNNLSQMYNGNARVVTATTSPVGLPVSITYNGSVDAPTNAGSYQMVGTVSSANYTGGVTNTLAVSQRALSAVADNATRVFGQTNPVFAGVLVGLQSGDDITVSYNSAAAIDAPAGSYDIVPTMIDPGGKLGNYAVALTNGVLTIVDVPCLLGITETTEGLFALTWKVEPQRFYRLQFKGSLNDSEWINLEEVQAQSASLQFVRSTGASASEIYRLLDSTGP